MSRRATHPPNENSREGDPIRTALRRLLSATDENIAAADRVKQARIELARVLESGDAEGEEDTTNE